MRPKGPAIFIRRSISSLESGVRASGGGISGGVSGFRGLPWLRGGCSRPPEWRPLGGGCGGGGSILGMLVDIVVLMVVVNW